MSRIFFKVEVRLSFDAISKQTDVNFYLEQVGVLTPKRLLWPRNIPELVVLESEKFKILRLLTEKILNN